MESATTACFTGYRPQKLPWGGDEDDPRCGALKLRLVESVVAAYGRGYRTFLSGMAQGVDTYAAEAVLALSRVLPGMELVCAVPYPAYALSLPRAHRARYEAIVLASARCAVCSEKSGSAAMVRRNRFMVENSSLVIAVYDGKAGGTRNTVDLAKETGRDIWLVSPNKIQEYGIMPVISAHEVKKVFVERVLFDNVSFEINEKDRVGLVGVNGCGKTTLFRMLAGQEAPDGGGIYRSRGARVMTMEQTVFDTGRTVYGQTLLAFRPLIEAEAELEAMNARLGEVSGAALDALILRQHELRERFEFEGGLTYKSRTRATLLGLGFTQEELIKPLSQMSGGQRNKAQLAGVLLSGADLLLLDEPTNHLDLDAVAWLEEFLKSYPGAFMVVSHDRYFLDRVTGRTMELLNGRLYVSEGSYSRHAELMADEQEFLRRKYARTQKEIARIERIVEQQRRWGQERNFITAASKQKQADRLRATLVAPERETASIRFHFRAYAVSGNDVAVAKRLAKSYGGRKVFSDTSLLIKRGERVFLLGPNGCGKTTLLRILLRKERPDSGECYLGANVQPGYYEQNLAVSHPEFTPVEEVRELYPQMRDMDIRRALGAFLFRGDDVFKKMGTLSGGEKARVQLLKLMLSGANFLVLDEPTNHLDIASREALEAALEDYEGTMLIVTHDRYLVERLADRVLEMSETGMEEYLGGYEDYLEQKAERRAQPDAPQESARSAPAEDYRAKKERQGALNRAAGEARRAEERAAKCEGELRRMEEKLAEPSVASDYIRAGEISAAMEQKRAELDKLYRAWEEAQRALEELDENN